MPADKPATSRLASLDQFRGYTVAGMFLVNFVGSYAVTPILLTHKNNFCSYADTIMPQFFFAVGFAFRLVFNRRAEADGLKSAYLHTVRRMLGLALVAIVVYGSGTSAKTWDDLMNLGFWTAIGTAFKRSWFQTLMHIAVTTLWVLPVIRSSALVRVAYMIASGLLQVVLSYWFYFDWVHTGAIDGGPLGFLSWSIPTIVGTLACDAVVNREVRSPLAKMFAWSAVLMVLGYLMSCPTTLYDVPEEQVASLIEEKIPADPVLPSQERLDTHALRWAEPPFVPPPSIDHRKNNYWMMSQRAATVSYHVFAAGFSLAVYAIFYLVSDIWGWQLGLFRTLGTNALVAYILHGMVDNAVTAFMPKDSPAWYVILGFLIYFYITYLMLRFLEKNKIFLKL